MPFMRANRVEELPVGVRDEAGFIFVYDERPPIGSDKHRFLYEVYKQIPREQETFVIEDYDSAVENTINLNAGIEPGSLEIVDDGGLDVNLLLNDAGEESIVIETATDSITITSATEGIFGYKIEFMVPEEWTEGDYLPDGATPDRRNWNNDELSVSLIGNVLKIWLETVEGELDNNSLGDVATEIAALDEFGVTGDTGSTEEVDMDVVDNYQGDLFVSDVYSLERAVITIDIVEENISDLTDTDTFNLSYTDSDGTLQDDTTISASGDEETIDDIVALFNTEEEGIAEAVDGTIVVTSIDYGGDATIAIDTVDTNFQDIGFPADETAVTIFDEGSMDYTEGELTVNFDSALNEDIHLDFEYNRWRTKENIRRWAEQEGHKVVILGRPYQPAITINFTPKTYGPEPNSNFN